MSKTFDQIVENRRSFYDISKEKVLEDDEIVKKVAHAVKHTPSAFNSQTGRVLVLLGDAHDRLWDIVKIGLKEKLSAERFVTTEQKLNGFQKGYGTVLFFEEQNTIKALQEQFSSAKDNFPLWSLQSSGMLQYNVWLSLEDAGYGASLQHYNSVIEEKVHETWDISKSWKLWAQMPFGMPNSQPDAKDSLPMEERIKVFK
ncbi:MAG: nitroreductase family protein [Eubacteriales bacterium]